MTLQQLWTYIDATPGLALLARLAVVFIGIGGIIAYGMGVARIVKACRGRAKEMRESKRRLRIMRQRYEVQREWER